MKKLLQNKRFRTNLYKWLTMYVCVMAIFTTVVTYSKYISSMGADETARVASFEVGIDFVCDPTKLKVVQNEDGTSSHVCDMGTSRPTSLLTYYFTVDSTKLETDAILAISILVDEDFEIVDLKNTTNNITYLTNGALQTGLGASLGTQNGNSKVRVDQDVFAKQGTKETYMIVVRYKDSLVTDNTNAIFNHMQNIVTVGYSATQKTR